jgi:hypothetical protein
MPKTTRRLRMGEEYDKEALGHLNKTIECEELAAKSTVPAGRERYGEMARRERDAAIEALEQAKIASGPELQELRSTNAEFPT